MHMEKCRPTAPHVTHGMCLLNIWSNLKMEAEEWFCGSWLVSFELYNQLESPKGIWARRQQYLSDLVRLFRW